MNIKNLTKRVADRHLIGFEKIDGKFKKVSPIIGTWFEGLISKLASLEIALGYAEKIATKEHKRLEALVKKKYGYSDNFEDDDYDDPLVQAFLWVDQFWGEVWTGKTRSMNKFQRKVEEAKSALQETIYNVNSWGRVESRLASQKQAGKIEGKFKEVSPVIGAWFESLMLKLDSIQKVLGYAEQIAQKESDKADKAFERVYGKYDKLSDEELDELYENEDSKGYRLMRQMQWADEFLAAVSSGRRQNPLQKAIEDAKDALGNWIHDSSNPYRETQRRASMESRIAEKYLTASRTVDLYMPSGDYEETQELETELEKELGFIPSHYTVINVTQIERWTELVRVKYKR